MLCLCVCVCAYMYSSKFVCARVYVHCGMVRYNFVLMICSVIFLHSYLETDKEINESNGILRLLSINHSKYMCPIAVGRM